MITVRHILESKPMREVWKVRPNESVLRAISLMAKYNIGALLVMEEGEIQGIISERDYSRKVILANRSSQQTLVAEIMSRSVLYVEPEDSLENCMALMTEKRVRHFPVMKQGALIGLISMGDIVKARIESQAFVIDQLTRYITDSYTGSPPPLHAIPERVIGQDGVV